ncbi:MAG: CotH kinase family protein [Saprospiraceae bacterium]|nr:CotH kinase family protein [Saprospiraceae bacterium]
MNLKSLSLILFLSIYCSALHGQLYINEWMASNSSVISDPDFDNTGDWIELFNDFNDPIDISGYYLTDNLGQPTKWSFPEGIVIEANSFLLIWADGENIGLHASFKLTKAGEEIGLYDKDENLLDEISFQHQRTNVSMGRANDGSSTFGFFQEPTPGLSNTSQAYTGITFYQPQFSQKGGLYDAPLSIEIQTIGGDIRYTFDGSAPTQYSELYTQPIEITQTTIIRATVFQENQLPGKPVTQTYFLEPSFQERELPILSITSDPKYFWDDSIGLYVQDFKPSWEYPINIELFENDGSDRAAFNELAGTKVNGLNSWVLPQKMLGIYFDNDYDKNNLDYQLFFDNNRSRFDNFVLRASGSDWGNTLFRDALSQGLTADNMNLEKMAFRPSIVYINGEYMGIHNMRSRIDEGFIEENFGLTSSEYDLIENNGKVEEGDNIAFYELFELFDKDLSVPANYNAVAEVADIQNLTDFYIAEIWSSNSSWGHNIQMWKPKIEGAKWRWILQDFDRSFTGVDDDLIAKFTTSTSPSGYNWARIPLNSLLQNSDFASTFAQRFTDHLFTTFHSDRVVSFINKHKDLIDQEIPYHVDRWAGTTSNYGNGLTSLAYWEGEVSELIDFANGRPNILLNDLKNRFSLDETSLLGTINFPSETGSITINDLPIPSSIWQGNYFQNMPFQLKAHPEVGQDFLGWSPATNEQLISKGSIWKYLDDGSEPSSEWYTNAFNDESWNSGNAKFGYGDNNETTTISFGDNANEKHITTYFRKTIQVDDPNSFAGAMTIELLRDDGAIVYINGEEVVRSNLPSGSINSTTMASTFAAGEEESTYYRFILDQTMLIAGPNTIAVEVHQSAANSSDLGFDLSLNALKIQSDNIISTERSIEVNLLSDSIFVANYQAQELCILPEKISTNTTLDLSCSPYYAVADVAVERDVTLTIEEGVEIYFPENANFTIKGILQIKGTEDAPVYISAIDPAKPWGGMIFNYSTGTSSLNYLELDRASNGNHPIYENAAISVFHGQVEMDHITIIDVESNPILSYYSNVYLHNSNLHSKVTGDLINIKYGEGEVTNTIFRGNNQVDTDAIDYDGVTNGKIIGNKIFNFLGFNSDGIDLGEETPLVEVRDNFIHNCTDKAISVGQQSIVHASNNIIVNCNIGIAVKDLSTATLDQNTFYNTRVPLSCFEKNVGLGGGISTVTNTIFSNSEKDPIQFDEVSDIFVTTSLSDTDSLPDTGNYFANPNFINPTEHNFSLGSESIALDNGVDIDGNNIQIGAAPSPYYSDPSLMITAIQYFPKGNQDAEFITIYNPSDKDVDLEGFVLSNAIDYTFPQGSEIQSKETVLLALNPSLVSQGIDQEFMWDLGRLSNEGEKIVLSSPAGIVEDHVRYNNKSPWPIEAEGNGSYLELIDPSLDNHFAESWKSELNTSTSDKDQITNIITYPNPASESINILSPEEIIHKLEIINIWGQTVFERPVNSNSYRFNTHQLAKGTYYIRINNKMYTNPIVIQ